MVAETHTTAINKLVSGNSPSIVTVTGTLLSGENLAIHKFVESNNAGKWIEHSGVNVTTKIPNQKVVGFLTSAVDASGGDTEAVVYVAGHFFADQLAFPSDVTVDLLKLRFLEGTPINITIQKAGEI